MLNPLWSELKVVCVAQPVHLTYLTFFLIHTVRIGLLKFQCEADRGRRRHNGLQQAFQCRKHSSCISMFPSLSRVFVTTRSSFRLKRATLRKARPGRIEEPVCVVATNLSIAECVDAAEEHLVCKERRWISGTLQTVAPSKQNLPKVYWEFLDQVCIFQLQYGCYKL